MTGDSAEIETIGVSDKAASKSKPLEIRMTVLYHPDIDRAGDTAVLGTEHRRTTARISRLEPVFSTPYGKQTGTLNTPFVSRTPVEVETGGQGGVVLRCALGMDVRVDGFALNEVCQLNEAAVKRGIVLVLADAVVLLVHLYDPNVRIHINNLGLVGYNSEMQRLRTEIFKVADLDDKRVLIRGESGTGKELVAAAVHSQSRRSKRQFEKINITEIPTTLAERELFGAAKHAGTGEPGHEGYFLKADGGTLFLDEIGDVDVAVQTKLLRAVETGEIQILGSKAKTKVDVRILAGTDVDLDEAVQNGRFKLSLFVRLSAYTLYIPPLRERRDDIGRLFFHFLKTELEKLSESHKLQCSGPAAAPWMPAAFVERLVLFSWPGNVRQLQNVAARVAVQNRGCDQFQPDARMETMLNESLADSQVADESGQDPIRSFSRLESLSDEEIVRRLESFGFNVTKAARIMNIERAKFYRYLKQRSIHIEQLRSEWTLRQV